MLREHSADPRLHCVLRPVALSATHSNHTAPDIHADEGANLFLRRLRPSFLHTTQPQPSSAFASYVASARMLCGID